MIILLILDVNSSITIAAVDLIHLLGVIVTYIALVLTIVSLIDYLYKNKAVLKEQN